MINCGNCSEPTKNKKYCSRSCATAVTNKTPKRQKIARTCRVCSIPVDGRRTVCDDHSSHIVKDMTLAEAIYEKHHRSSAYGLVRSRARASVSNEKTLCERCGYDKHVEVAHKRAIADFADDCLLSVINQRSNLMLLCPNCHWEHDHNL